MSDFLLDLAFAEATKHRDRLEAEYEAAVRALRVVSSDRGPMGLTPDRVRATPEWKAAKAASDAAFAALRSFNEVYTKRFAREIADARRARRVTR